MLRDCAVAWGTHHVSVILCLHVSGLVVDETVPCDPDAFLRHFHAHFLHYERIAHANTDN